MARQYVIAMSVVKSQYEGRLPGSWKTLNPRFSALASDIFAGKFCWVLGAGCRKGGLGSWIAVAKSATRREKRPAEIMVATSIEYGHPKSFSNIGSERWSCGCFTKTSIP